MSSTTMEQSELPAGWDEEKVRRVIAHYEDQAEEEAVAEDELMSITVDPDLEALALEGLNSGEPIEAGPGYWEEKHRRLDARLTMRS